MRRSLCLLCGIAVACIALGCGARQSIRGQETTGLDRKLAPFAWIEDGDLVTFIVDTRAARYRDDADYMPLEIAIANLGVKYLTLARESFILIDSEGNRYPAAAPRELIEGYDFLDFDRSPALAELEGLVSDKFAAFERYPARFSPTRTFQNGLVRDRMSLPRYGYLVDWIYFPKPATGIKGHRFELFLDTPELEEPIFLKFEVR